MALSGGAIAGIVIGVLVLVALLISIPFILKAVKKPSPGPGPGPGPTPQQCSDTKKCPSGQVCAANGTCIPDPNPNPNPNPQPCSNTKKCPDGQVCSNGTCIPNPIAQPCSFTNPTCPPGFVCDTDQNQCIVLPPGQCVTQKDCKNPIKNQCCLQNDGSGKSMCQMCCNNNDCTANPNGPICDPSGTCIPQSGCKTNADCPGQQCNTLNGQCIPIPPPTPPAPPQGRTLPWLQLGTYYIIPNPNYGFGTLVFQMLPNSQFNGSRISFQLQGDGNLATLCSGNNAGDPSQNVIGAFSFGGGFGPGNDSIRRCGFDTQNCTLSSNPCSDGQTCVAGKCQALAPGGAAAPWLVIGGQRSSSSPTAPLVSDPWLIMPIDTNDGMGNIVQQINFIHLPSGMYIQFQNDGNIVSHCTDNSVNSTLVSPPGPFRVCHIGTATQASNVCGTNNGLDPTTNTISNYCMGGTLYPINEQNGLILPWLQLDSWTIYSIGTGTSAKLMFENTGGSRVTYSIDTLGNVISYCRDKNGNPTTVSGSLGSGQNGYPGMVSPNPPTSYCSGAPAPVCNANQDCNQGGASGSICVGGRCLLAPTLVLKNGQQPKKPKNGQEKKNGQSNKNGQNVGGVGDGTPCVAGYNAAPCLPYNASCNTQAFCDGEITLGFNNQTPHDIGTTVYTPQSNGNAIPMIFPANTNTSTPICSNSYVTFTDGTVVNPPGYNDGTGYVPTFLVGQDQNVTFSVDPSGNATCPTVSS